jgi:signal peptidase I
MLHMQKQDISWKFILILFAILLPIRLFVAEPFLVYGSSMEPNFDTGDYLIVDELTYRFSDPKRGDVVVLTPPYDTSRHFIKRILALPGETIKVEGDKVTITNKEHPEGFILDESYIKYQSDKVAEFTLKDTEYFVAGDNRAVSYDSRSWGPLPKSDITGRAFLRLYPFKSIGILPGSVDLSN